MRAASVSVDITPQGKFWMEGYIHPIRKEPGLGVHDMPRATLLLVEVAHREALFVSIDVCILTAGTTDAMRKGLSSLLGIEAERIVINSIHTHSAANGFEGDGARVYRRRRATSSM